MMVVQDEMRAGIHGVICSRCLCGMCRLLVRLLLEISPSNSFRRSPTAHASHGPSHLPSSVRNVCSPRQSEMCANSKDVDEHEQTASANDREVDEQVKTAKV